MKPRTSRFGSITKFIITKFIITRFIITFTVALIGLTALVQAHTKLEKSEPAAGATVAAPKQIQLWFNEKLDAAVSKIELTGPSGKVELGPAHTMADKTLMAVISGKVTGGTYTVAWQTAGDDGHVVKGDYTFSVSATTH
ncbi:MAG TPA: copper resistance protein CopC [Vicinamibacterales bacterium]|jgi:methionine-rich copper-binding protein CopC|nr:copper resistance protein CopC [Vicinamibacterales bacterium]